MLRSSNAGIGALAGSTTMLLTVPWTVTIYFGRVDLNDRGEPLYKNRPKLRGSSAISSTGVGFDNDVITSAAKWVIVTAPSSSLLYGSEAVSFVGVVLYAALRSPRFMLSCIWSQQNLFLCHFPPSVCNSFLLRYYLAWRCVLLFSLFKRRVNVSCTSSCAGVGFQRRPPRQLLPRPRRPL